MAYPLWLLGKPKPGANGILEAWNMAEKKFKDMLFFYFPGRISVMRQNWEEYGQQVVAHEVYVYFLGIMEHGTELAHEADVYLRGIKNMEWDFNGSGGKVCRPCRANNRRTWYDDPFQ